MKNDPDTLVNSAIFPLNGGLTEKKAGVSKHRKKGSLPLSCHERASDGYTHEIVRQSMSVLDLINDAIIAKSLDGTVALWNPAAERMLGYSADEIMGRSTLMLFPSDRIKEAEEIHARAMQRRPAAGCFRHGFPA
jgi:PAS domain-containing protein